MFVKYIRINNFCKGNKMFIRIKCLSIKYFRSGMATMSGNIGIASLDTAAWPKFALH